MIEMPTAEELFRAARYWQWVADMACQHETITFCNWDGVTCSDCGHPVKVLSDVQLEHMKSGGADA